MSALKKWVVCGMVALGVTGCAGMRSDLATTDQELTKVYEVKAGKAKVFSVGRQWFSETFKSGKSVVDYEDKEEGAIIGNGSMAYPCLDVTTWQCQTQSQVLKLLFTMRLDAKDGRFKLAFSNVQVSSQSGTWAQMERADYEVARVRLLALGDQLAARIGQQGKQQDW